MLTTLLGHYPGERPRLDACNAPAGLAQEFPGEARRKLAAAPPGQGVICEAFVQVSADQLA
jgi:hypothetical protein